MVTVFGMTIVGCDDGSGGSEESDTWSDVTSLDQLNGYWKSTDKSSNETMTIQKYMEQEARVTWTSGMATLYGNINVTVKRVETSKMGFNVNNLYWYFIPSSTDSETYTFSGGNINNAGVWSSILENSGCSEQDEWVNNKQHSITMSWKSSVQTQPLNNEMLSKGLQINQNDTKIKVPAGFSSSILTELIMRKQ